ncbi:hypothetical protein DVH24_002326 [Malus domestica]|uniref:Uncharacterized protein n=1 Tax=Malus domestica TaxID=3750 RepID=A0A498I4Z1_MALDO|nr:hypothetical protein DVH24_002326 [Malus domestica]
MQSNNVILDFCVLKTITGTATLLHLFLSWFLVYKTSLGYIGAALPNSISYWINALLLVVYVRVSPSCKHTWTGFSMEAFRGIPDFIKLSIPSAVMIRNLSPLNQVCNIYAPLSKEQYKLLYAADKDEAETAKLLMD